MTPVYVAIPNWNGGALLRQCVESLLGCEPPVEVVIVDNGSRDGSLDRVRAEPGVHVLELGDNQGFVGAANAGLAFARERGAELCLLLNSDAFVAPDCIARLAAALSAEPDAVAAGPTIYYADRPRVIWSAGGTIDWRRGTSRMIGMDETDVGQFGDQPRRVPFVTGCALLVRLDAFVREGGLDPRFFAYWEEVEWCVRCARHGGQVLHVPAAQAWHHLAPAAREASPLVHYYMTRNRLLFLRTAGAPLSAWVRALIVDDLRTLVSWTLRPKWRGKRAQRDAVARALLDFAGGRFGRAPLAGS